MFKPKRFSLDINIDQEYLFVPLQVNTDTQILIHSDFRDMQEFIEYVENIYFSLPQEIQDKFKLVFKIHPMENSIYQYRFDNKSIVSYADTKALLVHASLVITIN